MPAIPRHPCSSASAVTSAASSWIAASRSRPWSRSARARSASSSQASAASRAESSAASRSWGRRSGPRRRREGVRLARQLARRLPRALGDDLAAPVADTRDQRARGVGVGERRIGRGDAVERDQPRQGVASASSARAARSHAGRILQRRRVDHRDPCDRRDRRRRSRRHAPAPAPARLGGHGLGDHDHLAHVVARDSGARRSGPAAARAAPRTPTGRSRSGGLLGALARGLRLQRVLRRLQRRPLGCRSCRGARSGGSTGWA